MRVTGAALLLVVACGGDLSEPAPRGRTGLDRTVALAMMDSALAIDRQAHLELNAELLAASLADTLVLLSDGALTLQPRDSVRATFLEYFAGARYHHWDDIVPPRIQLSDDNTMAWVSRVVCVDREEPAPGGDRRRRLFVSGYSATFLWRDGSWRTTSVTSTSLPEPPKSCP